MARTVKVNSSDSLSLFERRPVATAKQICNHYSQINAYTSPGRVPYKGYLAFVRWWTETKITGKGQRVCHQTKSPFDETWSVVKCTPYKDIAFLLQNTDIEHINFGQIIPVTKDLNEFTPENLISFVEYYEFTDYQKDVICNYLYRTDSMPSKPINWKPRSLIDQTIADQFELSERSSTELINKLRLTTPEGIVNEDPDATLNRIKIKGQGIHAALMHQLKEQTLNPQPAPEPVKPYVRKFKSWNSNEPYDPTIEQTIVTKKISEANQPNQSQPIQQNQASTLSKSDQDIINSLPPDQQQWMLDMLKPQPDQS